MKRTLASFLAAAISLGLGIAANAATWTGVGDMIWTQPDGNSFDVTYNNGDPAVFGGTGVGTVTVAPGGVTPGGIAVNASGYTFKVADDNGLGNATITRTNYSTMTIENAKVGTLALTNVFNTGAAGTNYDFTGGDFLLTGTIYGGANGGPAYRPAVGVTVTVQNGFSGSEFHKAGTGTLRIMAASTSNMSYFNGGTIEFHHDQALGTGTFFSTSASNNTFIAGAGARTLTQNIHMRAVTVNGPNDLTFAGTITGGDSYIFNKYGGGTTTLNGNNSTWANNFRIYEGVLVAGHANAFGGSGSVTVYGGGTMGIGPDVTFTKAVTWNSGSAIAGSGTYQRATSWTVPTSFTVAPGLSTGTLTLDVGSSNTVTLRSDTILEFEFASASDYDKLVVTNGGTLNLAGATLDLTFLDGYKPSFGQTFDVFSATTINNDIVGLTGDHATMFTWDISGGVLTLTSQVPEPASLSLLALAGLLVMKRRRRL